MSTNQATKAKPTVNEIAWDVIDGENTEFAAQYARLQWIHGSKQSSGFMKTGGLFISKEQYPNFAAEGFEPTVLITRDGTEIDGYAASKANLAIIRIKHQWVKDETYGRNVPLAHVLCVVKGCADLVCISLRGASKALDFQKAFNQHIGQNVAMANRSRPDGKPALEPFALWFPLQASPQISVNSKDGKSSSSVTPPEMFTPATLDRDYVTTLWVGAENYKAFSGFYKETSAWQKLPIWEQRNGDGDDHASDTPTHSGTDAITDNQAAHIRELCEAKGIDIKELVMTATNGETDGLINLTKAEASSIIETAKAY